MPEPLKKAFVIDDEPSERFPVWTRGNVGEVFAEVVSPLTWDLLGFDGYEMGWRDALVRIGAFSHDEFRSGLNEVCGAFGGYVYINVSASRVLAARLPGMSPEQMDRSLFGDQDAPPYVPAPGDDDPRKSAASADWLGQLLAAPDVGFLNEDKAAIEAEARSRGDLSGSSDAELIERARRFAREMRRYFGSHIYMLYGANVVASVVGASCDTVGRPELTAEVLAGLGDVDSTGTAETLWEMSRTVRRSPALTATLDEGVDELLSRLGAERDPAVTDFLKQWAEFVDQHGAYGKNMWELRSPTFATQPELALTMIDRLSAVGDDAGPGVRFAELGARREHGVAEVERLLDGDDEALTAFRGAAHSAHLLMPGRERAKTNCVKCLQEIRLPLRELGRRLVERGAARSVEDVFFVRDAELEDYVASPAAYAGTIAERRARLEELMAVEPPFVFVGDRPRPEEYTGRGATTAEVATPGTVLSGIGASPGVRTGHARIIRSIDEAADVADGDVLVAEVTDSTWGPLFLAAGAVIVEAGSPISHAVIVSRELGIPAVVSVPDAVRRIPDGARITVDGGAGTITIEGS
ncbi:PEP-utilizing enzyme [Streptomyces sp. NPDC005373]|uniref:PEP-utilizing enzyme n=1 Tax=Streptomyces sp. NPDC005373 TaxID=3156879 RepID=UPI0033BC9D04